jgi:hypothetical protein
MNASRERQIYNTLAKQFPGQIISPGYLRIETELKNSTGTYLFPIETTSGGLPTEQKLDRNDLFVVTALGIFLLREDSTKLGVDVLQSYPNKIVFPAAAGFNPDHLEAIYNGKFQLKIQSKVNIEAMSMHAFRVIPETQQSTADNKSQYSLDHAAYPLGTLIKLKGTMNVEVKVEFNTFDAMQIQAVAANTKHKLVFHPYGYLIKGAALAV